MSVYWKNGLWIGGVYWVLSLLFLLSDTYWASMTDFLLTVLLTLFLIPLNWLKPVAFVEKTIAKFPVTSTFLVAVGWIPYFSIFAFLVATIISMIVVFFELANVELYLHNLVAIMTFVFILRQIVAVIVLLVVAVMVLFFKKTIAGKLNKSINLLKNKNTKPNNEKVEEGEVKEKAEKTVKKKSKVKKEGILKKKNKKTKENA